MSDHPIKKRHYAHTEVRSIHNIQYNLVHFKGILYIRFLEPFDCFQSYLNVDVHVYNKTNLRKFHLKKVVAFLRNHRKIRGELCPCRKNTPLTHDLRSVTDTNASQIQFLGYTHRYLFT